LGSQSCPDDPFVETNIPADRRSIQFLREEKRTVAPDEAPVISFDAGAGTVRIKSTFLWATPRKFAEKNMIAVEKLEYDGEEGTLQIILASRQCQNEGGSAGGESAPYILTVSFPEGLPREVCVEEREGVDTGVVCESA
jgi:hypothetical protein